MFLPLFAVGTAGQLRRVYTYARSLETLNDLVSIFFPARRST